MHEDLAGEMYEGFFELFYALKRSFQGQHQTYGWDGLTRLRLGALGILSARGSLPVSELAKLLKISKSQATSLVDGLVEQGHLERSSSKADRRIVEVSLLPAGREALDRRLAEVKAALAQSLSVLSPAELGDLKAALATLVPLLNKMQENS